MVKSFSSLVEGVGGECWGQYSVKLAYSCCFSQGWKIIPTSSLGQVYFLAGQITCPNGQGNRQVIL